LFNKVDDLHWKSIAFLIKQELNNIVIGNWSTKRCVSKKNFVESITKSIMLKLRYFQFLQKLKYKCDCSGIVLNVVDESYTSKLCSFCGEEHKH